MTATFQIVAFLTVLSHLTVHAFLFPPSEVKFRPDTDIKLCTSQNQTFTCTLVEDGHNVSDINFYIGDDAIDAREIEIIDNRTAAYHIVNISHDMGNKWIGCYLTQPGVEQNVVRVFEMPIHVRSVTCVILDYVGDVTCTWDYGTNYGGDSTYPSVTLYVGMLTTHSVIEWTYTDLRKTAEFTADEEKAVFNQVGIRVGLSVTSPCGVTVNTTFQRDEVIKIQPYPVEQFGAEVINSTCILLDWTHNRKQRLKQYQISYTSKWNQEPVHIYINETKDSKNINSSEVCELVPGTSYTFSIRVFPLDNPGAWSQPQEITENTPEDVPASSPIVTEGSYSWRREDCQHGQSLRSVSIFMKPIPSIDERGRNVRTLISIKSHGDGQMYNQTTSGTLHQVQLRCNEAYNVTLQAFNRQGLSVNASYLRIAAAQEDFSKELLVERNETFDGRVFLELKYDDAYKDGSPTVFYTTNCEGIFIGDVKWIRYGANVSTDSFLLPQNAEPEHYCFGLAVSTSEGNTGFQWTSCQYIKDKAPTMWPSDLKVAAGNQDNTLIVTWSKWLCPDGEPYISHYHVSYCIQEEGANCTTPTVAVYHRDLTSALISDLDYEKEYEVRIRAVSHTNQTGPWSEPVSGKPVNKSLKPLHLGLIIGGCIFAFMLVLASSIFLCKKFRRKMSKKLEGEPIEPPDIFPGRKDEKYTNTDHKAHNMINNNKDEFTNRPPNVPKRTVSIDSGIPDEPPLTPPAQNFNNVLGEINEDDRGEINKGFVESPCHSPANQTPINNSHLGSYVLADNLTGNMREQTTGSTNNNNNNIDQSEQDTRGDDTKVVRQGQVTRSLETLPSNNQNPSFLETKSLSRIDGFQNQFAQNVRNVLNEEGPSQKKLLVSTIPVPKNHLNEKRYHSNQPEYPHTLPKDGTDKGVLRPHSQAIDVTSAEGLGNGIQNREDVGSTSSGAHGMSSYTKGYLTGITNLGYDNQPRDNDNVDHNEMRTSMATAGRPISGASDYVSSIDGVQISGKPAYMDRPHTDTTSSEFVSNTDRVNTSEDVSNLTINPQKSDYVSHPDHAGSFTHSDTTDYISHNDQISKPDHALVTGVTETPGTVPYHVSNIDDTMVLPENIYTDTVNVNAIKTPANSYNTNSSHIPDSTSSYITYNDIIMTGNVHNTDTAITDDIIHDTTVDASSPGVTEERTTNFVSSTPNSTTFHNDTTTPSSGYVAHPNVSQTPTNNTTPTKSAADNNMHGYVSHSDAIQTPTNNTTLRKSAADNNMHGYVSHPDALQTPTNITTPTSTTSAIDYSTSGYIAHSDIHPATTNKLITRASTTYNNTDDYIPDPDFDEIPTNAPRYTTLPIDGNMSSVAHLNVSPTPVQLITPPAPQTISDNNDSGYISHPNVNVPDNATTTTTNGNGNNGSYTSTNNLINTTSAKDSNTSGYVSHPNVIQTSTDNVKPTATTTDYNRNTQGYVAHPNVGHVLDDDVPSSKTGNLCGYGAHSFVNNDDKTSTADDDLNGHDAKSSDTNQTPTNMATPSTTAINSEVSGYVAHFDINRITTDIPLANDVKSTNNTLNGESADDVANASALPDYVPNDLNTPESSAQLDRPSPQSHETLMTVNDYLPHNAIEINCLPASMTSTNNSLNNKPSSKSVENEEANNTSAIADYIKSLLHQTETENKTNPVPESSNDGYVTQADISTPVSSSQAKDSSSTLFLTNVRNKVEVESLACEDALAFTDSQTLDITQDINTAESYVKSSNLASNVDNSTHTDIHNSLVSQPDISDRADEAMEHQSAPVSEGNAGYVLHSDMADMPTKPAENNRSDITPESLTTDSDTYMEGHDLDQPILNRSDTLGSLDSDLSNTGTNSEFDHRTRNLSSSERSDYSSMNESMEDKNYIYFRSESIDSSNIQNDRNKMAGESIPSQTEGGVPVRHTSGSSIESGLSMDSGRNSLTEDESPRNSCSDIEKHPYVVVGENNLLKPVSEIKQHSMKLKTNESQKNKESGLKKRQEQKHMASIGQTGVGEQVG